MDREKRIWASNLAARQRDLGIELVTNVYVSEAKRRIIFVPLFWADTGLLYEQGNPFVMDFDASDESLGAAIKTFPHAARKSAFKSEYVRVTIETTKANLRFEALKDYEDQTFVGAYIPPGCADEALGLLLKRLSIGASLLRDGLRDS